MKKVITAAQAAALIRDNDVVSISSSSGLGCPDKVLAAIGERFDREGAPAKSDHAAPDRRRRHVRHQGHRPHREAGPAVTRHCRLVPERPVVAADAAIWHMIVDNQIAAYNMPSGILFDMHRDAAARRPGVLTKVGLDTFVDPDLQGCAMNDAAADAADRAQGALRRRGVAVLPGHRAERGDHPRHHRRRARQPDLRARGRLSRRPRPGARGPQQRRHRHRAGQAGRQGRQRCGRTTCTCRASWSTTSSSIPTSGRRRRPSTTRPSAARSCDRWRPSSRRPGARRR